MKRAKKRTPRRPDLQALVRYWARVMRLQDYVIRVEYGSHEEMDNHLGEINVSHRYKRARMRVQVPGPAWEHIAGNLARKIEATVVHELAHVYFAPFETKKDSPEDIAEDQAVESITRAFMVLRYGKESSRCA